MRQQCRNSSHVHFIKKRPPYNIFLNETPDRMSYLKTLYDHFKYFQWERIIEIPLAFFEFSLEFLSENDLDLIKDSYRWMDGPSWRQMPRGL